MDVTDVPSYFGIDSFMVKNNSTGYTCLEAMDSQIDQGDAVHATSNEGSNRIHKQIVLDELFHLSYEDVCKIQE